MRLTRPKIPAYDTRTGTDPAGPPGRGYERVRTGGSLQWALIQYEQTAAWQVSVVTDPNLLRILNAANDAWAVGQRLKELGRVTRAESDAAAALVELFVQAGAATYAQVSSEHLSRLVLLCEDVRLVLREQWIGTWTAEQATARLLEIREHTRLVLAAMRATATPGREESELPRVSRRPAHEAGPDRRKL